jgi:hypothetical protein
VVPASASGWVNVAVKASLAVLLVVSLALSGEPQLEGKAMPLRAVFYPLAALVVPIGWLLTGRRRPYPHAADALIVVGLVVDTAGNVFDAYSWDPFDDLVHGSDTLLRTLGVALLVGRLPLAAWNVAALAVGFCVTAHTAWEVVEFGLDRWFGANLNVTLADTVGDSSLALAGAALAGCAYLWRVRGSGDRPSA